MEGTVEEVQDTGAFAEQDRVGEEESGRLSRTEMPGSGQEDMECQGYTGAKAGGTLSTDG